MSRSLYIPNPIRDIGINKFGVKDLRQKPLAFGWWQPDCSHTAVSGDEDFAPGGCTIEQETVVLLNGWAQPSLASGLEKFSFRLHADGSLEFKGHLSAAGAASHTVAFVLPGANPGEIDFLLPHDQFFHTTITTDAGTSFSLALVFIDHTTGEVTITWPVT